MRTVQTTIRAMAMACVTALLAATAPVTQAADSAWPEKVVTFEELHPLTPFNLRARRVVTRKPVTGPASMRVHVDASGAVARAVLLESCGNRDLDESALHAMRDMKFKPYVNDGVPTEVTLVVPVHVPSDSDGPTDGHDPRAWRQTRLQLKHLRRIADTQCGGDALKMHVGSLP